MEDNCWCGHHNHEIIHNSNLIVFLIRQKFQRLAFLFNELGSFLQNGRKSIAKSSSEIKYFSMKFNTFH